MDDAATRSHIQEHANAVVRGDMDAVVADFSADLQPHVPQIAQALPLPVRTAEVLDVEIGDEQSVAMIRYSGDDAKITIRSEWRDVDGRPVIVHAEPVS
jgi:hypothetical protein